MHDEVTAMSELDRQINDGEMNQAAPEMMNTQEDTNSREKPDESVTETVAKNLCDAVERRLREAGRARGLSRKGAAAVLFGEGAPSGDTKRNFADWLLGVRQNDQKKLEETYGSQKTALTGQVGSLGGYLVPEEFLPRLMRVAGERAIARPRATVLPMGSRSLQVPALDTNPGTAAGDTPTFGGLVARWSEEGANLTQTEPIFRQVELVARELSGYAKVSNALVQDSGIGLEALLVTLFGGAIAWHEDMAFLRGDGVGKPLGAVGPATGASVAVSRKTASRFLLEDAAKMMAKMLPGWSPTRTCWLLHPSVWSELLLLSDATSLVFVPDARSPVPASFFGLPVLTTEKLQPLGTARDVCLINWEHYLIGDRRQVEIAYSEHFAFTTNQSAWRFVARVDGQPWLRSPVPLADGSSTLSPFVYLQ